MLFLVISYVCSTLISWMHYTDQVQKILMSYAIFTQTFNCVWKIYKKNECECAMLYLLLCTVQVVNVMFFNCTISSST